MYLHIHVGCMINSLLEAKLGNWAMSVEDATCDPLVAELPVGVGAQNTNTVTKGVFVDYLLDPIRGQTTTLSLYTDPCSC